MKILFKDKGKEEKKLKESVKSIGTEDLRNNIKEKEEFIKVAQEEFHKRPDRKIKDVLFNSFGDILDYGLVIFIFGIIMLGAIPNYFDVNDEFLNPSSELNITVNESLDLVADSGYKVLLIFHDIGAKRPNVFFWLFFITVFMWLVYPLIKLLIFIYKKYKKGGKK